MRYRLLGLLLLITLSACQTTNVSSEKSHGAYYAGGRLSQEGPRNQFASDTEKVFKHRDLRNTTLLIYNHGTISSGIHQTCRTDWMPKYVRLLTYKDPSIVAYYFCSQESGGNSGDSIVNQVHYKRGIEIGKLSDKFQELGIPKDNIFLMGHSGGASSSLMAASRNPEKFNSYIVTAPGYGYAYLGGADLGVNYAALYENWKTLIQRGNKSKGIVYGFPGDKYSPAKDLDFMKSMKNIDYRVLSNKDDPGCGYKDVHAYPWTKCFEKGQTQNILSYIQRNRTKLSDSLANKEAKIPDLDLPKHGSFFTSKESPYSKNFGIYPTTQTFQDKFSDAFEGRDAANTVVFIYNHDLTNKGRFNRCDPTNIPYYLRNLIDKNTHYLAYSFCAPKTVNALNGTKFGGFKHKTRLSELSSLLDTFNEKSVEPGNIFLVGDNYGATTNILAALEYGHKFNSHISAFPDRDTQLKPPHALFDRIEELSKSPSKATEVAQLAPGLVYSRQELLKKSPLIEVAKQNRWSFITNASCDDSQKIGYSDNCFYKKNHNRIQAFVRQSLIEAKQPPSS